MSSILVYALCGVRVRSDVERKRLCGLKALDSSGSIALGAGVYSEEMTVRVLERIEQIVKFFFSFFRLLTFATSLGSL